ncbi:hypothetical protein ACS0TY_015206 [Phlomoides rotata]
MDEWLNYWFEWHMPWRENDVCHKRKVWTRWFGIPYHACNSRFFRLASAKNGNLVRMDSSTENLERLDYARVLLSAHFCENINQTLSIKIDGHVFRIKIMEEHPIMANEKRKPKMDGNTDEDSLFSGWSKDSIFSGPVNALEHGGSETGA